MKKIQKKIMYKCLDCEKTFMIPNFIHIKLINKIIKNIYCSYCESTNTFNYEYVKEV
jgi:DNA-directed RNA polymerase subunit RPC12/RpoP